MSLNLKKTLTYTLTRLKECKLYAVHANTAIPSGSNLNTYTTPGQYYVATGSIAQQVQNMPVETGGRLEVLQLISGSTRLFQLYYPNTSATIIRIYIRYYGGSTWADWRQISTTTNT